RDAPDLLFRRRLDLDDDADGLLLDALAEVLHDVEAHVGLQQRRAHILERVVDRGLVQLGQTLKPLLGAAKSLRERLEHSGAELSRPPSFSREVCIRGPHALPPPLAPSGRDRSPVNDGQANVRGRTGTTTSASARALPRARAWAGRSGSRSTRP